MLEFAGYLRRHGYRIGVGELPDLFRLVDRGARNPVLTRRGLRALCCRTHDEWREFDRHFNRFWFPVASEQAAPESVPGGLPDSPGQTLVGFAGTSDREPDSTHGQSDIEGSGAGRQRTLGKADFRFLRDRTAMH